MLPHLRLPAVLSPTQPDLRHVPPGLPTWPRSTVGCRVRQHLQHLLLGPLLQRLCRLEIHGQQHLAGLSGPVLLAPNHTSHLDTPVLLAALPPGLRDRVAVAAAADYFFRQWAAGALVGLLLNAFPFERRGSAATALRACRHLVAEGWSLALFPEGTRSPTGQLGPFRPGIGLLAGSLGLPVVPVRICGLEQVLPKGACWPRPGRVVITFGAPIRVEPACPAVEATRRIETAVRALGQE